ncbi:MAG: Verru_Chthon cassette protein A, partial [Verrucomicrobiota bacterium]|nr:Verru_Chthon cassette protein A [Verrucomicrobiota bacterium]
MTWSSFKNRPPRQQQTSRNHAVALIIVLALLALVSVLVIGFLSSVTTERQASSSYASGVHVRMLAESAVNLVIGQIQEATKGIDADGASQTWASQPGLIRTFNTSGSDAAKAYKLYSAEKLVEDGGFNPLNGGEPADAPAWTSSTDSKDLPWIKEPHVYADLNSPVVIGKRPIYPILSPLSLADTKIEGFEITGNRLIGDPNALLVPDSYDFSAPGATVPQIPMPVQWMYVLKDGTVTSIDKATTKISGATAANEIVGRMAFWTDDETSKININTAAGDIGQPGIPGAFWDKPRTDGPFERSLALKQVMQYEFQRYPGHPATVFLNTAFPGLTAREDIARVAPRIVAGGSQGGTVTTKDLNDPNDRLILDSDRLYASIDEVMFSPVRDEQLPGKITREELEKAKFFITAHSRAPEINLFNKPRISIWPIHAHIDNPGLRDQYCTHTDKLLEFCSRIGSSKFYFTRRNPRSQTEDFDGRNRQLYQYLQALTGQKVPGFAGDGDGFAGKYTAAERDQILTEIFDYIRAINLRDGWLTKTGRTAYTPPRGQLGSSQVLPIRIGPDNQGFGRFSTISEATILFYRSAVSAGEEPIKMRAVVLFETFGPMEGYTGPKPDYYHVLTGLDQFQVTVDGLPTALKFPATAENRVSQINGIHTRPWSGLEGVSSPFYGTSGFKTVPPVNPDTGAQQLAGTNSNSNYLFISDQITIPANTTQFGFIGGEVTLKIEWKDSAGNNPQTIQTIPLNFESIPVLPVPGAPEQSDFSQRIRGLSSHNTVSPNWTQLIDSKDTVRSLEPGGERPRGDLRLVAGKEHVPSTYFVGHVNYSSSSAKQAHTLRLGQGSTYSGGSTNTGKLVPAASYHASARPDLPSRLSAGAVRNDGTPGDWDNGTGNVFDGPYLNKADEGTTSGASWDANL